MNENKRVKKLVEQNTRLLDEIADLKSQLEAAKQKEATATEMISEIESVRQTMMSCIADSKSAKEKYDNAVKEIALLRKDMVAQYTALLDELKAGGVKVSIFDKLKWKWG